MRFGLYRMATVAVVAAGAVVLAACGNSEEEMESPSSMETESSSSVLAFSPPSHWNVPEYRFDPDWAKPLPEVADAAGVMRPQWTGGVAWVCADEDKIVQFNRGHVEEMPDGLNAVTAEPVIVRDYEGNVVASFGGLDLTPEGRSAVIPHNTHGCSIDYEGNIWVGGNADGIVQKWSPEGEMLLQIGEKGVCDGPPTLSPQSPWPTCGAPGNNSSQTLLNEPAKVVVDPEPDPVTGERGSVYIADGYGNHRIVVFDSTGKFLRQWGSMGTGPGELAPGGGGHPHCVMLANNGFVYVCDRNNNRLQVFDKVGNLQRVINVLPPGNFTSGMRGTDEDQGAVSVFRSVSDIAFSRDPEQKYIYLAYTGTLDGAPTGGRVFILDHKTGAILAQVGGPGPEPGNFMAAHGITVDSKENIYVAESQPGNRIQRFVRVND